MELVSPGAFERLLGGPEQAGATYGVLLGLGFAAAALGAVLAPRLARHFASPRAAAFTLGMVAVPLVVMVGLPQLAKASTAFVGFYLVLGAGGGDHGPGRPGHRRRRAGCWCPDDPRGAGCTSLHEN